MGSRAPRAEFAPRLEQEAGGSVLSMSLLDTKFGPRKRLRLPKAP
jgi:hypothetical protein